MNRFLLTFVLVLGVSGASYGQILPNGFNCEDLIDFANGRVSSNRQTSVLVRQPRPKDAFGGAMLSYDTELCRRLARKEITVDNFNALHAEKVRQLSSARQKAVMEQRKGLVEQQTIQNRERSLETRQAEIQAQKQAAVIQPQRAEAARRQQENRQDMYGGRSNSDELIQACGAKGLAVDFVTGNCVSRQSGQINPHNLYQPFAAPLSQPNPNDLIMRCGAQGRAADFATGRCM